VIVHESLFFTEM